MLRIGPLDWAGRVELGENLLLQLRVVSGHLLLTGDQLRGELVDALLHGGETNRHDLELLSLWRSGGGRNWCCFRSGVRKGGLRRQPAKLWR
jgi:hypothetical protein